MHATTGIYRLKKSLFAAEQLRQDVQDERKRWVKWARLVVRSGRRHRLVFIDESAITTSMVRLYGWGPRGERIKDYQTLGSWKTYSLIAAIKSTGWSGSMVIPGAVNADVFLAYLEQCLLPELKRGDIVVMDNVSFHHDARVEDLLSSEGVQLRHLPPYSPDFTPIENAYSAMKTLLRKLATRTYKSLVDAIAAIQAATSRQTCSNYFKACLNV